MAKSPLGPLLDRFGAPRARTLTWGPAAYGL
jgi:hypothetical protein